MKVAAQQHLDLSWTRGGDDEWECPGISPHPGRPLTGFEQLDWRTEPVGPYRVLKHTCSCMAVSYELVSCGGTYQVHRIIQSDSLISHYAGPWPRAEADEVWLYILAGRAR